MKRDKHLPFCSIVIANYNGKKVLSDCLRSIKNADYPKNRLEVIVADNNSTDGSVEFIKKNFKWVKVLKLEKNYGNTESVNRAVKKTKGDYIINLDNDTEVSKEWLIELVGVAKSDKNIGICGSKIFNQNPGIFVGEGSMSIFGVPETRVRDNELKERFFVSGCSMLVKKEVIRKLEYFFDPNYFAYFEDTDLCWRTRLLGYKVVFVPSSLVLHKKGITASKFGNLIKLYHYRNKILSFKKNTRLPLTQLLMMPVFVNTFFMMMYLSLKTDWEYGINVLKQIFSPFTKTKNIEKVSLKKQLKLFFV